MNLPVLFLGFFLLPVGLGLAGYIEASTRPYTTTGLIITLIGFVTIVVGTQIPEQKKEETAIITGKPLEQLKNKTTNQNPSKP